MLKKIVKITDINDKDVANPVPDIKTLKKIKWDTDSPRFKEAQLFLGFTDEDLTLKELKEFQNDKSVDKKIV